MFVINRQFEFECIRKSCNNLMEIQKVEYGASGVSFALSLILTLEPLRAHEISDGQVQLPKVSVPPHRYTPLKKAWMDIYSPVYEQMKSHHMLCFKYS